MLTVHCDNLFLCPPPQGALSDTAIHPSVCPGLDYITLAACSWPANRDVWTRPQTDVDPPRVELPSAGGAGAYRFGAAEAIICC